MKNSEYGKYFRLNQMKLIKTNFDNLIIISEVFSDEEVFKKFLKR